MRGRQVASARAGAGSRRAREADIARCTGTMRIGDHLRATRVFVRRARPARYFNRVPSRLPATDDGRGRSIAADLDSGGGDDMTWAEGPEDSIAGAGGASGDGQDSRAAIAGSAAGDNSATGDNSAAIDSSATGDGSAGKETETEFPATDVAFLSAPDSSGGPGPASPAGREPGADSTEPDSTEPDSTAGRSEGRKRSEEHTSEL